ncbi:GTP cyclohydrolase 1 feedback regulatory protein, partial [Centrocercus urophasianus]|uniref:GTP cyclohydrolase 1 feedback regulatory protein n=1 Tax=Centrocercus urophasianus TaxID=9002 RepID=UPI001C65125B
THADPINGGRRNLVLLRTLFSSQLIVLPCSPCIAAFLQEVGPTMVGDEHSDPNLMQFLGARKRNMLGNHFWEYYVNDAPRIVLNKLETCGYRVVSMTGVGQTLVWCLHKE